MFQKIVSVILSVLMLFSSGTLNQGIIESIDSFVSAESTDDFIMTEDGYNSAGAQVSTWDGTTSTEPSTVNGIVEIRSAANLAYVMNHDYSYLSSSIKLFVSIDWNGKTWNPIAGYLTNDSPVSDASMFRGSFDGNGFTISNFSTSVGSYHSMGFFGIAKNCTIKNVGFINCSMVSTYNRDSAVNRGIGLVVGTAEGGVTITDCFLRGCTVKSGFRTGGFIGTTDLSGTTITNCYMQGCTITSTGTTNSSGIAGGFVGYDTASGRVTIQSSYIANTTRKESYTGNNYTGAFVGKGAENSYPKAYYCYYTTTPAKGGDNCTLGQTNVENITETNLKAKNTAILNKLNYYKAGAFQFDLAHNSAGSNINGGYPILSWEYPTYTISYNANGGSGAPAEQTKIYGITLTLSTTKPTRTGYTFQGWGTSSTATTVAYAAGASYTANAAITLYAIWKINTYAVSYDANGGSGAPSAQTKTHGTALTLSSTKPTKTGYTFKEWNTAQNGSGTSYAAGASYTANAAVTLYAQWTANGYTVTFNANGGSGAPAAQTKTYGTALTLSSTKPTKTGYTFKEWNTAQNGSGTSYAPGASYTANAAVTLYAQWTANKYKVLFDTNDGNNTNLFYLERVTNKTVNGITYSYDPSTGIITLNGTGTASASTTHYTFSTLPFAVASGDVYTVSLDYISGSVNNGYLVLNLYDSTTTLWFDMGNNDTNTTWTIPAASASTINRIELWGWYNANSGPSLTFNNYQVKVKIEKSSSKTTYTPTGVYATYGSAYGTLPTPTRTGYTFNGWWTAASGGAQVTASTTVSTAASQTLYAHWTASTYTVNFDANGGNVGQKNKTVTYDGLYGTLPTPTREGYTFAGWFTEASGGTQILATTTVKITATQTLYAHWLANERILSVDTNGGLNTRNLIYYPGATATSSSFSGGEDSTISYNVTLGSDGTVNIGGKYTGGVVERHTYTDMPLWVYLEDGMTYQYSYTSTNQITAFYFFPNGRVENFVSITENTAKVVDNGDGTYTYSGTFVCGGKGDIKDGDTGSDGTIAGGWSNVADATAFYQLRIDQNCGTNSPAEVVSYSVTDLSIKEVSPEATSKYKQSANTTIAITPPKKVGHEFAGWYTAADGGTLVSNSAEIVIDSTKTVYAHWEVKEGTLSVDTNGGLNTRNLIYYPDALEASSSFSGGDDSTISYNATIDPDGTININGNYTGGVVERHIKMPLWVYLEHGMTYQYTFTSTNLITAFYFFPNGVGENYASLAGYCAEMVDNGNGTYTYSGTFVCGGTGNINGSEWKNTEDTTAFYQLRLDQDCGEKSSATVTPYSITDLCIKEVSPEATSKYKQATNTTIGIPNPVRAGYIFDGWYTEAEGGTKVTSDTLISIAGNHTLYAHWSRFKYNLSATSVGSYMTVSLNGETAVVGDIYQTKISEGTEITLNAIVNEGETREFMFWVDDRGRIVSYTPEYTFILEADKEIEAVYSEDINSEFYTVAFVDSILKTVLDIQQVEKGTSAKIPATVAENAGYVFDHWDTDTSAVNGNLTVNAVYRPLNKMFTITTAIGTTVKEAKYYYNTKVRVEITDSQIPEGKYFGGWLIDGSDTIASYDEVFEFYAYKDMTVTAVFADKEVEATATVTLASSVFDVNTTEGTYKASLMVTRELPENLVLVSSGLLLTQTADYGTEDKLTFEEQSENSSAIRLYRTVHTTNDGQYQLTVKTSVGKTFYARGFVVYLDTKTGDIITLYTDVQQVNSNS